MVMDLSKKLNLAYYKQRGLEAREIVDHVFAEAPKGSKEYILVWSIIYDKITTNVRFLPSDPTTKDPVIIKAKKNNQCYIKGRKKARFVDTPLNPSNVVVGPQNLNAQTRPRASPLINKRMDV